MHFFEADEAPCLKWDFYYGIEYQFMILNLLTEWTKSEKYIEDLSTFLIDVIIFVHNGNYISELKS